MSSSYGTIDLGSDPGSSSDNRRRKYWPTSNKQRPKTPPAAAAAAPTGSGVSYDTNNQPISANTFGSVNPDVLSEVDLNTTSETEHDDRPEPNILERALERTICYYIRRKSRASKLTIGILSLFSLGFHAATLVVTPIYVSSMRKSGGDEAVILLALAVCLPLIVVLTTLFLKHTYDKTITLRPTASRPLYLAMGLCLALRLNVGVFCSHPDRTNWSLQPMLASSLLPLSMLVTTVGLCKRISCRRLVCVLVMMVSVFICAEPRVWDLDGSDDEDLFDHTDLLKNILWPTGYAFSFLPLAIYYVLAEREIKNNKTHSLSLSASGALVGSAFTILMASTDFIPYYGRVDTFQEMWDAIKDGIKCNFGHIPDDAEYCLFKFIIFTGSVAGFNFFSFLLIAASEGTVFLSLVTCLAAPVASGFWTVFHYDFEADSITWRGEWNHTSIFVVVSLVVGTPAVVAYAVFSVLDVKKANKEQKGYSDVSSSEYDWE